MKKQKEKQPVDLDSVLEWIKNNNVDIDDWVKLDEDHAVYDYHHTTGRFLRNELSLWEKSPLRDWFNSNGIYHADDMSGIILTSLHRQLNDKPIQLEDQIQYYRDYWKEVDPKVNEGSYNDS